MSDEQLDDWPPHLREILTRELPGRADDLPGWQFDEAPLSMLGPARQYLRYALHVAPEEEPVVLVAKQEEHPDYLFEYIGLRPPADGMATLRYPDPRHGPLDVRRQLVIRRARAYARRSIVLGELAWMPTNVVEDRIIHAVGPYLDRRDRDLPMKRAAKGIELLCDVVYRPGPKAGTVKASKYKTADEWRAAIRERVLPKETRLSASDDTIALWLGISPPTMYRLIGRWGPSTLEELRNGKF